MTKKSKKEIQNADSFKAALTLEKLKALLNLTRSDVQKGNDFNLTFNVKEDVDKAENSFSWSYTLPEEVKEEINSVEIDKEINALLLQSKAINYENQALADKQYHLNNLSKQYLEEAKKFKSALDEKAMFKDLKLDSLVFNKEAFDDHWVENPLIPLEKKTYERATNKREILLHRTGEPADIINRVNTNVNRLKTPFKGNQLNTATPLTIDFNGKRLVLDNNGIRLKKSGKTSNKSLKKVVFAFGDNVVHVDLNEE